MIDKLLKPGSKSREIINYFRFLYLAFANHIVSRIPSYIIREFFYRYMYGMKIGKNSHIQMGVRVYAPSKIKIGTNCSIGHGSLLDGRRGIEIGNYVDLAGYVRIFTLGHDLDDKEYKSTGAKVKIGDYASLFTGVYVLPGRTIAEGTAVALSSVVTKDTLPWSIYAGNPAKLIRARKIDNLTYERNYKRYFH
ncbi:acyltransferase [Algoriphagus machipongonensis]|uniref:Acetyltransferase n=1 Tax=Algoriphagus machipongonensis TaxID=388413 RepID=A3HRR7_9BACT|nr:acyltransferase [Algoriphagus machipongonensis]EAZ82535.1 acetyltransferase [Algoriphagus machipongonensis]